MGEQVYVADNLAFFPFQVQDEPLFVIHQIDIIVSVAGSNLMQSFKEVSSSFSLHPLLFLRWPQAETLLVLWFEVQESDNFNWGWLICIFCISR